eukprot:scaffold2611_cov253-Ochromonas_danica.AAC.2
MDQKWSLEKCSGSPFCWVERRKEYRSLVLGGTIDCGRQEPLGSDHDGSAFALTFPDLPMLA